MVLHGGMVPGLGWLIHRDYRLDLWMGWRICEGGVSDWLIWRLLLAWRVVGGFGRLGVFGRANCRGICVLFRWWTTWFLCLLCGGGCAGNAARFNVWMGMVGRYKRT